MKSLKINIILPFIPSKPGGGLRVMFEYANHLSKLGHKVRVYFPAKAAYLKNEQYLLKYFYFKYFSQVPSWFSFNKNVQVKIIKEIKDSAILDGDIIFFTWWSIVYDIAKLSGVKGRKFNLVQDIETWNGNEAEVVGSYSVEGFQNVVIAKYLFEYLNTVTGKAPHKISFAIDNNIYKITQSINRRSPKSIIMLYSDELRKGSKYGLEALLLLKKQFEDIKVTLFGIPPRPEVLPAWIDYYQRPSNLVELYNDAAIFLGPSNQEGCALPPMEAMYCGCAVVCTDIDGHRDYSINGKTTLEVPVRSSLGMYHRLAELIQDNDLRIKVAKEGNRYISEFTWGKSTKQLEEIFLKDICK